MKFQNLWDRQPNSWPAQPYQPEFVRLLYSVYKGTISMRSFGFLAAEQREEDYYKCRKSNEIQRGFYSDALADCGNLNSSIQTYLTEVGL